ncbi:MAG: hypothetical protein PHT33_14655 [bacterium]|nr:hypothetical protein [bacterium]
MEFVETAIFTKKSAVLLPDDSYKELQETLILQPRAGDLIPAGGGLRKVRWRGSDTGKRGGLRIIYYWDMPYQVIFMLYAYKKGEQEDLTPVQLKMLRNAVKEGLA